MKSKAPLVLIEQLVMLAVFALAATLCLRIFVWSNVRSEYNEARDTAALTAQSAAETVKSCAGSISNPLSRAAELLGGSYTDKTIQIHYDEEWNVTTEENYSYSLTVQETESGINGLCKAQISVMQTENPEELFRLETAWQEEVRGNE